MLMKRMLFISLILCFRLNGQVNEPIVLGYFPSWSETWVSANQDSPLRRIPSFVNYVFLSFAKPDLTYTAGSYDISGTGIGVPYDGCALKESVSALKDKGVNVILSIGGETYWGDPNVYSNIHYQQIKDLVDDIGFAGIDWDFEPNGSFADIGNAANVQHFIDFINNSRALMPANQGYLIACAPSGVGALGGQTNNDAASPYRFANRNSLTGETDANLYNGTVATNGINLFGFSATGHMIPVLQAVGDKIDIVAFQGYNCGGSTNRAIMYDAYAHYAEIYGFHVAAGVHYPNEPWGPYYNYTHENVASLSDHIRNYPTRVGDNDGIMIWQLLLTGTGSSAYSYMHVGSQVLNGTPVNTALTNATNFTMDPYTGGAEGCEGGSGGTVYCGASEYNPANDYPTAGTLVYYDCQIWENQWWTNAGEAPGSNSVWVVQGNCNEGPGCECNGAPTYSTIAPVSCGTYTSPGGLEWSVSGTYHDTITNAAGCDSIMTINLTINGVTAAISEANDMLTASSSGTYQWFDCANNYTVIAGQTGQNFTPATDGNYAVSITNNGCSDTSACYAFMLCNGAPTYSTISPVSCGTYTSPGGSEWSVSGTYHDTITNAAGCDSIMTINLTVNSVIAAISEANDVLTASPSGTYQWLDCANNYAVIAGQTEQHFEPTATGNYAVSVTNNGCSDTSACFAFVYTGLNEAFEQTIQLFPNPSTGDFRIVSAQPGLQVTVTSLTGQIVFSGQPDATGWLRLNAENGVYQVEIRSEQGERCVKRLVIHTN